MTTRRYLSFFCLLLLLSLPPIGLTAQDSIHILKKGETLYSLARTFGIPFADLVAANKLVDAGKVQAGQKIIIPGKDPSLPTAGSKTADTAPGNPAGAMKTTPVANADPTLGTKTSSAYVVQKGDTLYGIARKFTMSLTDLRTLNTLKENSVLKVGQRLTVMIPAVPNPNTQANELITETRPAPPTKKTESASGTETRSLIAGSVDSRVLWPVRAKELAYMDGKLYGVLLTAERSERVLSLTDGTVVSAEPYRGFGKVAIVQAPTGLVYVYGGNESLSVKQGDRIAPGAELGRLGTDAHSGKPQLFLFVYKDNKAIDPATAPRS